MENAVDALKIAFAVMVFAMALTLAISTFSQARETSEAVLYMNDKTNYYSWEDEVNYLEEDPVTGDIEYKSERIVGIDAIIPTLYRYYKENYTVIFDGIDKPIYYLDSTGKWNKDYTGDEDDKIFYFDLNSEISRNCPWVGTVNDIKKNLDLFLKGTTGYDFGNASRKVKYDGFIDTYANATFLEELGEYSTDRTYGMNNGFLEVQDNEGDIARFEQVGNLWKCIQSNDDFTSGESKTLQDIATTVGNSPSAFLDSESGEVIELAKPTIKRVIKYTLIENNP